MKYLLFCYWLLAGGLICLSPWCGRDFCNKEGQESTIKYVAGTGQIYT